MIGSEGRSTQPFDDVTGKNTEIVRFRPEGIESGDRRVLLGLGRFARSLQTPDRRIGRLVPLPVRAGRFAQHRRRRELVEKIVGNLKGETGMSAVLADLALARFIGPAEDGADLAGGLNQRAGLAGMDAPNLFAAERLALGANVRHLAADQAARPTRRRQQSKGRQADLRVRRSIREHFEGSSEKGVSGQDGETLVELNVKGGAAAPQRVVVDRREIVVHQRKTVHQLDRTPRIERGFGLATRRDGGGHAERGANPFAGAEHGVPHRLEKLGRIGIAFEQRGQTGIGPFGISAQPSLSVHLPSVPAARLPYSEVRPFRGIGGTLGSRHRYNPRMAEIRPFRGLRYAPSAGPLPQLVAPPYDVLSPEERDAYAAKSPHNVVHLTLPEGKADDRSKMVKYAKSAALLAEWRREGALKREESPSFYRYTQSFTTDTGLEKSRTALLALIKVEPYERGVVLPHEQTFPKHKEDRLRLLEATRTHLESIFGLFEDEDAALHGTIRSAPASDSQAVSDEAGVDHQFERIDDPDAGAAIAAAFQAKRIWIADGHHRYETAVNFRAALGERPGPVAEDYMMMALSSMSDPGLELMPTHRMLAELPIGLAKLEPLLQTRFNVRRVPNVQLVPELHRLAESGHMVFGVALPGGSGYILTLADPHQALKWIPGEGSDRLKMLDVTVLHRVIFEQLLGLSGTDYAQYTRDASEAIGKVGHGIAASFLMNPPSVEDMKFIALGGEKMPQKSTYYYPKLLSGLVFWSLADFEA